MKRFYIVLALTVAYPAVAAPIAIERGLAPKSELIEPRFAVQAAESETIVDHAAWATFLQAFVVEGADGVNRVRYDAVASDDRARLNDYIASLEGTDVDALARSEQIAFWVNLYNATTVRLVLQNRTAKSIRDIKKPWDIPVATVAGRDLTLNNIEHGIIRPIAKDARIHYAVNCASLGCPNLSREAFTGARLDEQLDAAARAYVNHPRGVRVANGRVTASKIFGWYREDFGGSAASVLVHIRQFAEPRLANALAAADKIHSYQYDWSLNDAP
jgi:hypothetical protein